MNEAAIIFPNQLYESGAVLGRNRLHLLVEDSLFFEQFTFHQQKLVLHRASMDCYARELESAGYRVRHLRSRTDASWSSVIALLVEQGIGTVHVYEPSDDWIGRRLAKLVEERFAIEYHDDPGFLSPNEWLIEQFEGLDRYFFTDFYIAQRKRLGVLMEGEKPAGGRWSFDTENRKKLPRGLVVPKFDGVGPNDAAMRAIAEIGSAYPTNPGTAAAFRYATNRSEANKLLDEFLTERFERFGDYEDAIDPREGVLFHSVLTPALNIGLITPSEVVARTLERHRDCPVPLNSLEGFLRQIIGWREYMRAVYLARGRKQRTRNFWGFTRRIPSSWWSGETGIEPVDTVIRRVLGTAYCHHIERLMVLGNFMLLCEFDPDDVYRWFMEVFIDSYDWVMVPNVYAMSQFADGGEITTKPYISGSNYILKMSSFTKGTWCRTWDALYWRFIHAHADFFAGNPRLGFLPSTLARMDQDKLGDHLRTAERFLELL